MEYEALTDRIIAAAIEVHCQLGPGFIESIYEKALIVELRRRGLKAEPQVEVLVFYTDVEVGKHRLDLLIEDTIVIELKAIKDIEDIHFAVARSYLKAMGKRDGLILNFAKTTLEVRRVICR